ncbi:MAG: glycerol-3-phosphate 1-O-acyltransferase PlsY [Pseudomonadota bacterium]
MTEIACLLLAYAVGSISSAVLVCRLLGLPDPRGEGSGNPGATNVMRIGGKGAAAATLAGDAGKGLLPTALAAGLIGTEGAVAACALGSFVGHVWPVWFQFKGGKGVATALGALFGTSLLVGVLAGATWLAVALAFRISSLAALATFAAVPAYLYMSTGSALLTASFTVIAAVLFVRHRDNIGRLLRGEEPRIGG